MCEKTNCLSGSSEATNHGTRTDRAWIGYRKINCDLHGGKFQLDIDGDLFKVTIVLEGED